MAQPQWRFGRLLVSCICLSTASGCREGTSVLPTTALEVPAAPGSSAPRLTGAEGLPTILSWLEPAPSGTALRYSVLGANGWGPARTVAKGSDWLVNWADLPSMVTLDDSLWAAHWLVRQPSSPEALDVAVTISRDAGRSWDPPVTPHAVGTASPHGFVSLFPASGGVGALWLDGGTLADGGAVALRSAVITADGRVGARALLDERVCDCCQTDVALGASGPLAAYRGRSNDEIRDVFVARWRQGRWQPGQRVAADDWQIVGCPINGPAITAAGRQVAVAWFSAPRGEAKVEVSFSNDGGESFGTAQLVAAGRVLGRVDVALAGAGDAIVSWLETSAEHPDATELRIRRVGPDAMAAPRTVAVVADRRSAILPQIKRHGADLVLVWPDTRARQSQLRAVRLPLNAVP